MRVCILTTSEMLIGIDWVTFTAEYAELMHDARRITEGLAPNVLKSYLGDDDWLFFWSDIPGRVFCRYEELTEVDDIIDHDTMRGMAYIPPEGSPLFLNLIASFNPQLSERINAICGNVTARNAYLEAYLAWVEALRHGDEQRMPHTEIYERYLSAEGLAIALASQTRHSRSTAASGPSTTYGGSTGPTRSRRTSRNSCNCSIL
ncbi:hypothetical protein QFC20_004013 [Naganishia adeliensis]|uniref:Uncharacterized protein n=1 Tax=Naganishia adeliensis TaxID=92952 RepID=A0ACC2W7V4_9TREE|nr:hypothetical protein QFC20_004013 [Naganishia adeliensis]